MERVWLCQVVNEGTLVATLCHESRYTIYYVLLTVFPVMYFLSEMLRKEVCKV